MRWSDIIASNRRQNKPCSQEGMQSSGVERSGRRCFGATNRTGIGRYWTPRAVQQIRATLHLKGMAPGPDCSSTQISQEQQILPLRK
jgi:hypothetical protein